LKEGKHDITITNLKTIFDALFGRLFCPWSRVSDRPGVF